MTTTTRAAVIGSTGKGNYGHGLDVVWREFKNAEIVAVADENEAGRAAAQKRLGARNAYADYRDMLKKERPQIVSVADRHLDQHRDMVIGALERLMKGRTVITIAHRLSTIRNSSKILVLKEGVVAEQGTHDELMKLGGVYAELYRVQFEGTSTAKES